MSATARLAVFGMVAAMVSVLVTWVLEPPLRRPALQGAGFAVAERVPASCSVESGALTGDRVSRAMRQVLPGVLPCVSASGPQPTSTLVLRLQVACTGAVESVVPVQTGDWPQRVVGCVRDRLSKASFPSHGAPEGEVVDLPITLAAGLDAPGSPR